MSQNRFEFLPNISQPRDNCLIFGCQNIYQSHQFFNLNKFIEFMHRCLKSTMQIQLIHFFIIDIHWTDRVPKKWQLLVAMSLYSCRNDFIISDKFQIGFEQFKNVCRWCIKSGIELQNCYVNIGTFDQSDNNWLTQDHQWREYRIISAILPGSANCSSWIFQDCPITWCFR